MEYIKFSLLFVLVHTGAYLVAGLLAYRISRELYHGENRLLDFLKDMSDKSENARVAKWSLPLQLVRGLLLSIVLYPILGLMGELSYALRFIFLAGLYRLCQCNSLSTQYRRFYLLERSLLEKKRILEIAIRNDGFQSSIRVGSRPGTILGE